jgi:aryl sulfotransferase
MNQQIKWPEKTRELQMWVIDSTYWNDFKFRDDDIIIASYAKAGITWMQQIVAQFIFDGDTDDVSVGDISPWVDFRLPPPQFRPDLEAQEHRRFVKTHLPVDALVFSPKAKYIYIGRDGRDVVWSFHNMHYHTNDLFYDAINALPDMGPVMMKPNPTSDLRKYFHEWLEKDGYPTFPFWANVHTWWGVRDLPNVYFIHYQNLKDDLEGQMHKIAAFLDIAIDDSRWDDIVRHCTFDYMKKNAASITPMGGAIFEGGAKVFINKGTNGRWRDTLTKEDIEAYEARTIEELGPECAHWLATGEYLK